jgi:PTH1 family peptidyl-tRNA hydrolase
MNIFKRLFGSGTSRSSASAPDRDTDTDMKRYLIACLGNIGPEYEGTRHNAGFMVADRLADDAGVSFRSGRYGDMATVRIKNCELLVLKPSTFMNLSGVAVRYWMNHEKLPLDRLLVVVDDLALPFGTLRLRKSGSDAGHNGLKNIAEQLGTQNYARLRFGVGNDFPKGGQIDFVLGKFPPEERAKMPEVLKRAAESVSTFCLAGPDIAMNRFNH